MQIYRTEREVRAVRSGTSFGASRSAQGAAVTIGTFDGLHLGHQALFQELVTKSDELKLSRRILFSFYPHPRAVLSGFSREERLRDPRFLNISSLRSEIELLPNFGITELFLRRFSREFSSLSPEGFLQRLLLETLQAKLVVVGHDWSFGKERSGGIKTLKEFGERSGIVVSVVDSISTPGWGRVSSSAIRELLTSGAVERLSELLGREFSVFGRAVPGDGRGGAIGFPTANLHLPDQLLPADGVYRVTVQLDGVDWRGAANIGFRPTFSGVTRRLEVHLLDLPFQKLYGKRMKVIFHQRIRGEMKFSGVEELKRQIAEDITRIRSGV